MAAGFRRTARSGVLSQAPGPGFNDADDCRCWVRDSAIGDGVLKRRLRQ